MSKEEMVDVEIDITDETFLKLAKMAHEKDITFNQLCNEILREQIEQLEKDERN